MKIVHVTTYDKGGAGKACARIHMALLSIGVDSSMIVLHKTDPCIPHCYPIKLEVKVGLIQRVINKVKRLLKEFKCYREPVSLEKKYLTNRPAEFEIFSFPVSEINLKKMQILKDADVVHLHWMADLLDYKSFFTNNPKKIIWTLHDMNPFTGGCHYSSGCTQFDARCDLCPQLKNTRDPEYSLRIFQTKELAYKRDVDLTIVTPSVWLNALSSGSTLLNRFKHEVIRYACDETIFKPLNRNLSREVFSLSKEGPIFLYIADYTTKRKGYDLMMNAINSIPDKYNITIAVVGGIEKQLVAHPRVIYLGRINDDRLLCAAYSACNYLLMTSLEDNLPNVIIESLFCGTPVIAFETGGIPEMIQNQVNGITSTDVNVESLINMMIEGSQNPDRFDRDLIRSEAVMIYNNKKIASEYLDVYNR